MKWSNEHDNLIIELYKTLNVNEISKQTGFTQGAITARLHKLGVKDIKKFKWDEPTLNKVLELTKTHSIVEISKIMNVSRNTIASKLQRLGVKAVDKRPDNWSEEEIEFLKANYSTMNKEYLAKKLGRSYSTIVSRASMIGIAPERPYLARKWTKEDEDCLRKNYNVISRKKIAQKLGRTEEAIHLKAKKMKLGNKTEKRITISALSNILGCNKNTIHKWYAKSLIPLSRIPDSNMLYISLPKLIKFMETHQELWDTRKADYTFVFTRKPKWLIGKEKSDKLKPIIVENCVKPVTMSEIKQIKKLYADGLSIHAIAIKLNRGENTIKRYITDEHLTDYKAGYYTKEELKFIENNRSTLSVNEIALHLNRSVNSIKSKIKRIEENETVTKIKKLPWTEEELDKLKKNLDKSIPQLEKIIKTRSYRALDHKKRELLGLE